MRTSKNSDNLVAAILPVLIALFAISAFSFAANFSSNPVNTGIEQTDLAEEQLTIAHAPVQPGQASLPSKTEPKTEEEEKESENKNEKHLDALNVPYVATFFVRNVSSWLHNGQVLSRVIDSRQLYMLYHSWKIFHSYY
jgi:hypothetical protein